MTTMKNCTKFRQSSTSAVRTNGLNQSLLSGKLSRVAQRKTSSDGSGPGPSPKARAEFLALTGPKPAGRIFRKPEKSPKIFSEARKKARKATLCPIFKKNFLSSLFFHKICSTVLGFAPSFFSKIS